MFAKLQTKEGLMGTGSVFLITLTIFIVLLGIGAVVSLGILTSDPANRNNVITVSGMGEAYAVPDIATFGFTSRHESKEVKEAQAEVSKQVAEVVASLEKLGIKEKDIKTTSYNSYPKYEWRDNRAACDGYSCPPSGEQVLVGYEQSQSIEVRVRDLEKVSDVLQALGDASVDSLYGPNFEVDDDDAVKTAARKEAIAKANAKAEELASELGVKLGKIVSFSDSSNDFAPYPMARGGEYAMDAKMVSAEYAPEIPTGEDKITANVSITYKIR